jgi:hypothetical protein
VYGKVVNSIEFLPLRPYMGLYGINGDQEIEALLATEIGGSALTR